MMVRFTQRDASLVRLGEIAMILELHRQGVSVSAIARQVGLDRRAVQRSRLGLSESEMPHADETAVG